MSHHWKATTCNGITLVVVTTLIVTAQVLISKKVNEQQRQIDQLCNVVHCLATRDGDGETKTLEYGKLPSGDYNLYLADYRYNSALMIYNSPLPSEKRYDGKTHYVCVTNIPSDILRGWAWHEVCTIPAFSKTFQ